MNLSQCPPRTDVQDTDNFVGYRTPAANGEGRWSAATLRSWLAGLFAPLAHASDMNNPHAVTQAQVGLGNVDNTSDAEKPVSAAQAAAVVARNNSLGANSSGLLTRHRVAGKFSTLLGAHGFSIHLRSLFVKDAPPLSDYLCYLGTGFDAVSLTAYSELRLYWNAATFSFRLDRSDPASAFLNYITYEWVVGSEWAMARDGRVVQYTLVRPDDLSAWVLYIDGVALAAPVVAASAGSYPTLGDEFTANQFGFFRGASTLATYAPTLFTVALSQVEVAVLVRNNGLPAESHRWGTPISYVSDFSGGLDGWGSAGLGRSTLTGNLDGVSDGTSAENDCLKIANIVNSAGNRGATKVNILKASSSFRVKLKYYIPASNTEVTSVEVANGALQSFGVGLVKGAWATLTLIAGNVPRDNSSGTNLRIYTRNASGAINYAAVTTEGAYVKAVEVQPLGAILHWPLDEGLGCAWRDISTNGSHASVLQTVFATGSSLVEHVLPRSDTGRIRAKTSTAGSEPLSLDASGLLLPAGSQILRVRARAQTGAPAVTLGTSLGGNQIVAAVSLAQTWKLLAMALADGVVSLDSTLWATSDTTDVIEWDITWEPLSA